MIFFHLIKDEGPLRSTSKKSQAQPTFCDINIKIEIIYISMNS